MENMLASVIIPVYARGVNLAEYIKKVEDVVMSLNLKYEIILVGSASFGETWRYIETVQEENSKIVAVRLSGEFGKDAAIYAGCAVARGVIIITLDSDVSIPLDLTGTMVSALVENKVDIAQATRALELKYKGLYAVCVKFLYKTVKFFSGFDISMDTDFKVFNKKVLDIINSPVSKKSYYRGIASWSGVKSLSISFLPKDQKIKLSFKHFLKNAKVTMNLAADYSGEKLRIVCGIVAVLSGGAYLFFFKSVMNYMNFFNAFAVLATGIILAFAFYVEKLVRKKEASPRYTIAEILFVSKNIGK